MIEAVLNGFDLFGQSITRKANGPVAERFGFSPFSVLDARSGEWQDRKRAWLGLGIKSEVGRSAKSYNCHDWMNDKGGGQHAEGDGTSIFDPTLCECIYRWFSNNSAQVIDPFAGGAVRGIVAGVMGRKYWGCDIRKEQIEANNKQANEIMPEIRPEWVLGDADDVINSSPEADLVFSCPPYGDLEKYSDNPNDLSNMEWHAFAEVYKRIIAKASSRLKKDRFACFVVGDFRDKRGFYRDFVSMTISAFKEGGAELYNEAILVTSVGSACMRVTKQFESGRKFAKTHQNVLVFCKGDWRKAAAFCNGNKVCVE